MNLIEMQKKQKELDERIIRDKNIVLSSEELFLNTCVALDVELAEMMNDHQGFKIWKENRQPKDGLLEEVADCISFFLSIANQLEIDLGAWFDEELAIHNWNNSNLNYVKIKGYLMEAVSSNLLLISPFRSSFYAFINLVTTCFGFTLEQLEESYYKKNEINHERQTNGY